MKLALLSCAFSLTTTVVSATQVTHRPDNYLSKLEPNSDFHIKLERPPPACSQSKGGKVNMGYYVNWAIYARKFTPLDMDISSLTHIYYALADTDPTTGKAILSDLWADQQIPYPGDNTTAPGNNLYGNLKQLYLLKKKKRSLKTILSFGGWTFSQAGHWDFAMNKTSRATFVQSAIQLLEDNGFDGMNIDWEYPNATQAEYFVSLLKETRAGLDEYAKKKGDDIPYELTIAVPAGAANYQHLLVHEMNKYVTSWNLMAYDYSGPWSPVSDYLDNVYGGAYSGVSTDASAKWYLENGASREKFVIGMPCYGRGFENTDGIFQTFNGSGPGTWQAGLYDYKALPFPNATVYNDLQNISSYSYDPVKKELIAYDTPKIASLKAQWVVDNNFAGGLFWELSADKNGTDSLVWNAATAMENLDNTLNHLNFPGSQFDNIRSGMGGFSKRGHRHNAEYF
ncbi:chitinase [Ceratobasidium sp. AG-Ba]|nr:chitinase [Ceratobasidium sp. AG-Ba]